MVHDTCALSKEDSIIWEVLFKDMEFLLLVDSIHVAYERFEVIYLVFPTYPKKKKISSSEGCFCLMLEY